MKIEEADVVRTACNLHCPDSCVLDVDILNGRPKIRAVQEHPITQGVSCPKARKHLQRLQSGRRITRPMFKHRDRWTAVSWDQALSLCAEQIRQHDPAALLHIQSMGARGVSKAVVDHFFTRLGATKTFGSLCDETGILASIQDFGALDHNDILDLTRARVIVNWGKDLSRSSVHLARIVSQARELGTRVVSIWPGGDGYQAISDELIRVAPGQDRFLALAVVKVLLDRNRIDQQAFRAVSGWPGFKSLLDRWTVSEMAAQCGVGTDTVELLAGVFARGGVSSLIGWGLQRHLYGGESVRAINALAWLSGNVGSSGSGVSFNISSDRNLDLSWLQAEPARKLSLPQLEKGIRTSDHPPIRGAWINGANIVTQSPGSAGLAEVLSGLEFVVVVDGFMTDTARCADLVLPSTLMFEEEEVFGSCLHDWVQLSRPAFSPPGECRSDFEIVRDLNARLGSPVELPPLEECFERSLDLDAAQLQTLKTRGFVQTRPGWIAFSSGPAHPDGTFHLLQDLHPDPETGPDYPLQLLSLVRRHTVHSQLGESELMEPLKIWVHPLAARAASLDSGQEVDVVSPLGRIRAELRLDSSLDPGVALCRRGGWLTGQAGVNRIIEPRVTDLGVGSAYYAQRIRIEGLGEILE